MSVTYTGSGTITVNQTPVEGTSGYPGNRPYVLTFNVGANVTALSLTQTFTDNTDLGAPQSTLLTDGYINGSILLSPGMTITMNYVRSSGVPTSQPILDDVTNTESTPAQVNATIQLEPANNSDEPPAAFDRDTISIANYRYILY